MKLNGMLILSQIRAKKVEGVGDDLRAKIKSC